MSLPARASKQALQQADCSFWTWLLCAAPPFQDLLHHRVRLILKRRVERAQDAGWKNVALLCQSSQAVHSLKTELPQQTDGLLSRKSLRIIIQWDAVCVLLQWASVSGSLIKFIIGWCDYSQSISVTWGLPAWAALLYIDTASSAKDNESSPAPEELRLQ